MRLFSRSGWVLTSSNVFSPKFHPVQEILHSESNKRFEAGSIYVGNCLGLLMGSCVVGGKVRFSYLLHRVSLSEDDNISQ